jgi:hypothetical protein
LLVVTEFPTAGALLRFDGAGATGAGFFCGAAFAAAGFFGAALAGAAFFDGAGFAAAFFGAGFFAGAALAALAGAFFDAAATGFFTGFATAFGFTATLRAAPAEERAGALPDFARLPATGLLFAIPNPIL